MYSLLKTIFLLYLTSAGLAYSGDNAVGPLAEYAELLDWTIVFCTLMVTWYLLFIIGGYHHYSIRSEKLGDKFNALIYIPCLFFMIFLMICEGSQITLQFFD